ncbi:MAG: hypothetical protein OXG92_13305 [Chloroflexi bacterium]|nr:hypothetical protein [Chloroflexota bacterium]MCY3582525.1 hypothetical protein [Chloroflexota bacterium]MCY3717427.1 hypothetical protein [Chloroflexota bacterium]MDE2650348.1 hypothetical protein [Chloroflexota bacterium]MXX51793.1 hypothetical protein [Chloroflexota bacterium]
MNPTTALALLYSYATSGELVLPDAAEAVPEAEYQPWADHLVAGCTDRALARRYKNLIASLGTHGDIAYEAAKFCLNLPHTADLEELPIQEQSVDSMVALTSALIQAPCMEWLDFQAARTAMLAACWMPMLDEGDIDQIWVDGVMFGVATLYWHRLKRMWSIEALREHRPRDYATIKHAGDQFETCDPSELGQLYQDDQAKLGEICDLTLQIAKKVSGLSSAKSFDRNSSGYYSTIATIGTAIGAMDHAVSEQSCREWIDFQAARAALITASFQFPDNADYHDAWSQGLVGPLTMCYLLSLANLKSAMAKGRETRNISNEVLAAGHRADGSVSVQFDLPPGSYVFNVGGGVSEGTNRTWEFAVADDDDALAEMSSMEKGDTRSGPFALTLRKRSTFYVWMNEDSNSEDKWFIVLQKPDKK